VKYFFLKLTTSTIRRFALSGSPFIIEESIVGIRLWIGPRERRVIFNVREKGRTIIVVVVRILESIPENTKMPFVQNSIVSTLIPSVIVKEFPATWLGCNFFTDELAISVGCPFKNSGAYCRWLCFSRKSECSLL
jgi:hypothetical protein